MLIKLFGMDPNAVISAVTSTIHGDHLNLIINTRERYVHFRRAGYSLSLIAECAQDWEKHGKVPGHDCVEIFSSNDASEADDVICEVVFIAENDAETDLLRGACYISQDKDQIQLLKVKRDIKLEVETIAEFRHLPKLKP